MAKTLWVVLGLVALGQSNSRGTELRRLQQQGGYEQLLLTDATQLKQLIDLRLGRFYRLNDRPLPSETPSPASYQRGFLSVEDIRGRHHGPSGHTCVDPADSRCRLVGLGHG